MDAYIKSINRKEAYTYIYIYIYIYTHTHINFLGAFQNIVFYRICEADPLSTNGTCFDIYIYHICLFFFGGPPGVRSAPYP